MNHYLTDAPLAESDADALVVGIYTGEELTGPAKALDEATGGSLASLLEAEEISAATGTVSVLLAPAGISSRLIILVGLGDSEQLNTASVYTALGAAARKASERPRNLIAFYLPSDWDASLQETAVCAAVVGCEGQDLYRAEKKRFPFAEVHWQGITQDSMDRGSVLGEATNFTRRLVNEPPDHAYPVAVAEAAEKMAAESGLAVETWDLEKLTQERCGCLLAVAQGSEQPPRLVILRHQGGPPDAPTLALVGKGVTFDSGGLSLKPSEGMQTMKCDMAGAATVLGAMQAIAGLRLPVNVIGLVGLVENLVSGNSYKLGDVLTSRSGTTVEVLNTDAEGRLVLADVLDVAREVGATRIIDLATLTGACVVALGLDVSGLMTNHQDWCDAVASAARYCGEMAWQMPMFEHYDKQIKSEVADIKNIGEGRWGGAITAAKFLEQFVGDVPWTHVDIAGPAFADKPRFWTDAGATGTFVRTLVEVARRWPTQVS